MSLYLIAFFLWASGDVLIRVIPLVDGENVLVRGTEKKRSSQMYNTEQYLVRRDCMENRKESLWVQCPFCGGKTRTKVYENTVLLEFPLYCPKCKKEILINVIKLKMVLSEEPSV